MAHWCQAYPPARLFFFKDLLIGKKIHSALCKLCKFFSLNLNISSINMIIKENNFYSYELNPLLRQPLKKYRAGVILNIISILLDFQSFKHMIRNIISKVLQRCIQIYSRIFIIHLLIARHSVSFNSGSNNVTIRQYPAMKIFLVRQTLVKGLSSLRHMTLCEFKIFLEKYPRFFNPATGPSRVRRYSCDPYILFSDQKTLNGAGLATPIIYARKHAPQSIHG